MSDTLHEVWGTCQKCPTDDRTWCMALIGLTLLFLFADQNLLAPNLTACADDLGISHEERDEKLGGQIALGFFLLGAPAAIAAG